MNPQVLLDTGPLVAFLRRDDDHHVWAKEQLARVRPPLFTCEAVLSETFFLLGHHPAAVRQLVRFLSDGIVKVTLSAGEEIATIGELMLRYRNVPMSFAAACLVRMAELHAHATVLTLDEDFRIYRKNGRQVIPLFIPPDR